MKSTGWERSILVRDSCLQKSSLQPLIASISFSFDSQSFFVAMGWVIDSPNSISFIQTELVIVKFIFLSMSLRTGRQTHHLGNSMMDTFPVIHHTAFGCSLWQRLWVIPGQVGDGWHSGYLCNCWIVLRQSIFESKGNSIHGYGRPKDVMKQACWSCV